MKVTVEVSDSEMRGLRKLTGEKKKGPAIRKTLVTALNLQARKEMAQKFISGELGVELRGFEEAARKDKLAEEETERRWRE